MFLGVFPVDEIPVLGNGESWIFNNKKLQGEHWLSLIRNGYNTYLYDSFGRKKKEYIDLKYLPPLRGTIDSNYNREQDYLENNCGARCVSFLELCYKYSPEVVVKYI